MDGATLLTGARLPVLVERVVKRRQIFLQIRHLHLDTMHERAAFEAVPFEGVDLVGLSLWFHHKTDGFRRPLRRMSYMRGQQEYFALSNRHIVKITVVADLQHHVALQLVKEFLQGSS